MLLKNCPWLSRRAKKPGFLFHLDDPPETTQYWILCAWPYHGFYVLHSNDKWWTCRSAAATVTADLSIHQGYWGPVWRHVIFDKEKKNIHEVGVLSGVAEWDFSTPLIAGIPVTIKLTFDLGVTANIYGTRAELNFADGSANYVAAPQLWIVA